MIHNHVMVGTNNRTIVNTVVHVYCGPGHCPDTWRDTRGHAHLAAAVDVVGVVTRHQTGGVQRALTTRHRVRLAVSAEVELGAVVGVRIWFIGFDTDST